MIVDYRPNAGIRIAPHFYTSDEELERAVTMIDEILRTEAWQPLRRDRRRHLKTAEQRTVPHRGQRTDAENRRVVALPTRRATDSDRGGSSGLT